ALRALDAELGAAHERRADGEGVAQQVEQLLVEIDEPLPAMLEDTLQVRGIGIEEPGLAVGVAQRGEMAARPRAALIEPVVDFLVDDALLLRALDHRHGKPARAVFHADAGAALVIRASDLDMG